MTTGVAVSDTSPLIAPNQIARLDLLQAQFEHIIVPPAVVLEVAPSVGDLPAWVHRQYVSVPPEHLAHLHDGEREAIALATQLGADFLVIDDLPGRRAATRLGLRIIGSLGVSLERSGAG